MKPLLRVLSLGAGVQSSTLYLMACAGLHAARVPLDTVDFEALIAARAADPRKAQLNLFESECEGMCGV